MREKNENREHIEGRVYQHNLEIKKVSNQSSANYGREFISGNLEIAVDENLLNVIPVHFTYVTEMTSSGKVNSTYGVLRKIIEEKRSVIEVGKDEAFKVKIDTAIGLNDFYTQDNRLVSTKVNEGGFVSLVNELGDESTRNTFKCDMIITNAMRVEADPEKNQTKDYVTLKGAIFNFRNDLLPVDFKVEDPQGMDFFESLGASTAEPVFTTIWGKINCGTIVNKIEEETAFGEAAVRTYEKKVKDWIVTGTSRETPYIFGEEEYITVDEFKKKIQDRETMLADIKKRSDDYRAQKNVATATVATTSTPKPSTTPQGTFTF